MEEETIQQPQQTTEQVIENATLEDSSIGFRISLSSLKYDVKDLVGLCLSIKEEWFKGNQKKKATYT